MRETKHDIHKVFKNYDPKLHPHAQEREYKRALNATKLERVFAKPFIGNLSGHGDVVSTLLKHQTKISIVASGAYDGQIKIWNLADSKCLRTIPAHESMVRAMCISRLNSNHFFSVDSNSTIKKWRYFGESELNIQKKKPTKKRKKSKKNEETQSDDDGDSDDDDEYLATHDIEADGKYSQDMQDNNIPIDTTVAKDLILGMDHHYYKPYFVTCGDKVQLWEENRKEALMQWSWGADTVSYIKYNPVEADLFVATSQDRAITLFDQRNPAPLRKVILTMRSNQVCWNPMEAFRFTVANEDHDLHTFDMRNLSQPICLHKDHTSAVIALDYSPTGLEIVSGSYDKTVRIFAVNGGHSRDVYHTKRMQKLTDVIWSLDNRYIVSASDEMNIRLWRARASEKICPVSSRERLAFDTNEALKEKYKYHPEIRRISRHRHLPKLVYHAMKEKRIMIDSRKRKESNRIAHSRPGTIPIVSEKKKKVFMEEE